MKVVIEIDDKKGCVDCPFCSYETDLPGYNEDGFWCRNSHAMISNFYNNKDRNGVVIPSWCKLKDQEVI